MQGSLAYAHDHREGYLAQLFELLRIPSISTLPEYKPDIQRAAEWLSDDLRRIGLRNVAILPTGGHPVVYGDLLDAGPGLPTVLVYGHYDVQPVDPLDEWDSGPFEPEIRDGLLYARGATDDKGQMFTHVKAVESILAAEGRLPVNIKFLLEGEEEVGSRNLGAFVSEHKELLAADSVLISDTGFFGPGQPMIITGLRGIAAVDVQVVGPSTDLHSGTYGGTIHNPAQVIGEIIAALHDEEGRVTVPGFYDEVRVLSDAEHAAFAEVPYTLRQWQEETGMQTPWGEPDYSLVERVGARPTCEVNGVWGGFQGEGIKTIVPARAGAKFTMRLVPDQDPVEIARLFAEYVNEIAPDDVQVEVQVQQTGGHPFLTAIDKPEIEAAAHALEAVWGVKPYFMRGGGSIPVVAHFAQELDAPIILMGFRLPGSRIHAPNENFPLDHFYRGIDASIHYLHYLLRILTG